MTHGADHPLPIGQLIHRAERLMEREIQSCVNDLGITFSMFHFLRVLMREDGRTHKDISREAGLSASTTASAMKSLEKGEWVTRRRGTVDTREIYVHLTAKAKRLKPLLDEVSHTANERAASRLTAAQTRALQATLREVIAALEVPVSR